MSNLSLQVFVGIVVRDHLMVLLRKALARSSTVDLDVKYEDLNYQFVTAAARHLIWEQQVAVLQVSTSLAALCSLVSLLPLHVRHAIHAFLPAYYRLWCGNISRLCERLADARPR